MLETKVSCKGKDMDDQSSGRIRRIDPETADKIRASMRIVSVRHCVEELGKY